MRTITMFRKTCTVAVASVFLAASFQAPLMAAMVDNDQLAMQAQQQLQRDEVRSFMARADVREAMLGYGVSSADVDARINNLTESELLQIQDRLAMLPAGGDGVLGAVVLIFVILILLDVLGATDIFPGI
ncbi:MAG: PA2779 family protein [Pseudomonadota bacterium]